MKDCNQCGKCCVKYGNGGLTVTDEEISLLELFRPDIAEYIDGGTIWVDPETGQQMLSCPWLEKVPNQEKYTCRIYYDRPNDCKYYPVTVEQMIDDECEMLEANDLQDLKQAQKKLDALMIDSRPPVVTR